MVPAPIPVGQAAWTREQQLALLASTGLLAVHPKDAVCGEPAEVNLCVPNLDARASLVSLLAAAWNPRNNPPRWRRNGNAATCSLAATWWVYGHERQRGRPGGATGFPLWIIRRRIILAIQEFHVCTASNFVLLQSTVALPTPARFKFIPEVRCLKKFDASSTLYTLTAPASTS